MGEHISKVLGLIKGLFKYQKLKMLMIFTSAILFLVLLFPYSDLSDYTTSQISKATKNTVFLTFEDMGIGLLPTPSVDLEKVQIDTPAISDFKMQGLSIAPSIKALLSAKAGANISMKGVLKGNIDLSYKQGGKYKKSKANKELITVEIEEVDLSSLKKYVKLPVNLKGQIFGEIDAILDQTFSKQPEADIDLNIKKFIVPSATLDLPIGPINLPTFSFKNVKLKGKLKDSELQISEAILGGPKDLINGKIKGKLNVKIKKRGAAMKPEFKAYNFRIDLNIAKEQEKKIPFFSLLSDYTQKTNKGSRLLLGLSGSRFGPPPKMKALKSF